MLLFSRPAFKSGTMIVRVTVSGTEHSFGLHPHDKGTVVNFGDNDIRDAILAKYPAFFSIPV